MPTPKSEHWCLLGVISMNPGTQVQWVDFIPRGITVLICLCLRCYIIHRFLPTHFILISTKCWSHFFFSLTSRVLQRGGDGLTQPRCSESPLENLCPLFTLHWSTPSTGVKLSFGPSRVACAPIPLLLICHVASSLSGTIA